MKSLLWLLMLFAVAGLAQTPKSDFKVTKKKTKVKKDKTPTLMKPKEEIAVRSSGHGMHIGFIRIHSLSYHIAGSDATSIAIGPKSRMSWGAEGTHPPLGKGDDIDVDNDPAGGTLLLACKAPVVQDSLKPVCNFSRAKMPKP